MPDVEDVLSSVAASPRLTRTRLSMSCTPGYPRSFEVIARGERHTFHSFECAIYRLAPRCEHCGGAIVGHGIEADGRVYCCARRTRHHG